MRRSRCGCSPMRCDPPARRRTGASRTRGGTPPRGLDALAEWQRSFGSLDLATSLVMHGDGLIFAGLRSAVRSRRPEVVFDWSERARHLSQQISPAPAARRGAGGGPRRSCGCCAPSRAGTGSRRPARIELSERVRRRQWASTGAGGSARPDLARRAARESRGRHRAACRTCSTGPDLVAVAVVADGARVIEIGVVGTASARRMRGCGPTST